LSRTEGLKFALTVGGAFLVLALFFRWRERESAAVVLATIGGVLVLAGLVMPTRMGPVQAAWMALGHAIGRVTTPIILGILYFGLLTPMGLLRRTFGGNPIRHDESSGSFWIDRARTGSGRSDLTHQF
jgi:hypothetical protein